MIITVASFKGGVAKTTTAIHLAAYLQNRGTTLLIDGDPNRSATGWARRGKLPFRVIDERQAARFAKDFAHVIIDTEARPTSDDLKALAEGCDLLIIPSTPDALALDALILTVDAIKSVGEGKYKVLLTIIPPKPSHDGDDAMATVRGAGLPLFKTGIKRLVAFQKAALAGVPVSQVSDPKAAEAWESYKRLGMEILR